MLFGDVIGQEEAKARLIGEARSGRVAHALLLCGNEGCGAMPLALVYARFLLCRSRGDGDEPCGGCSSCRMSDRLEHPDLHFMFPIYKLRTGTDKPTYCDEFLDQWRSLLLSNPYFGYEEWMDACGAENHQLEIYASESDSISRKLSLMSSQGGYKVVVVWLPEKMNVVCANKLLKLLEEPPAQTVFLMVSERPDLLLQTIRSRTQRIDLPRLSQTEIVDALVGKYHVAEAEAVRIARSSAGNMTAALRTITDDSEAEMFFDLFVRLMRLSYMRKVKEMKLWSETVAGLGRERQKAFLNYCQRMVRENFVYNFGKKEINYMREKESEFAVKFAPFINERNVIGIMDELSLAMAHVVQNVNPKIVFFDFSLKMIVLIKNR